MKLENIFSILWSASSPWNLFPLLCRGFKLHVVCSPLSILVIIFFVGEILLASLANATIYLLVLPVFSISNMKIQVFDPF